MTSPSLSLGPVLDLIERAVSVEHETSVSSDDCPACVALAKLRRIKWKKFRQLAEQHAAQLRGPVAAFRYHHFHWTADGMEAAADFLCAPPREPEAE